MPFYGPSFIVAGLNGPGFKDGSFKESALRDPEDVYLSEDTRSLYIADRGNHSIRKMGLSGDLAMETIAGNGEPGGSRSAHAACLSGPSRVWVTSDDMKLLVLDQDGKALKVVGGGAVSVPFKVPVQIDRSAWDGTSGTLIFSRVGAKEVYSFSASDFSLKKIGELDAVLQESSDWAYSKEGVYAYTSSTGRVDLFGVDGHVWKPAIREPGWASPFYQAISLTARPELSAGSAPVVATDGDNSYLLLWHPKNYFTRVKLSDGTMERLPVLNSDGSSLEVPHNLVEGAPRLAFDPRRMLTYMCEGPSHVVRAWRFINASAFQCGTRNSDWIIGYQMPKKKPEGVTRVLVVGVSLLFSGTSNLGQAFPGQLEDFLNYRASRAGSSRRFEVLCVGTASSVIPGGAASWIAGQPKFISDFGIDVVLVGLDYISLVQEVFGFTRADSRDDVLDPDFNHEKQVDGLKVGQLDPIQKVVAEIALKHVEEYRPFMDITPAGHWDLVHPEIEDAGALALNSDDLMGPAARLVARNIRAAKVVAEKNGATMVALFYPTRQTLFAHEITDKPAPKILCPLDFYDRLDVECAQMSVPVIDAIRPLKVIAAAKYPMNLNNDPHFMNEAHKWLGLITADSLFDLLYKEEKNRGVGVPSERWKSLGAWDTLMDYLHGFGGKLRWN